MISKAPSPRKEIAIVSVMALGFGLVGIDRFLISTLFPVIAADLHLSYGDIGTITGALAFAWGIAALLMGNLSDRIGRRRVLTGSLIVFSLLIGGSGLATGLISLILVRIVMGLADGAYTPASIAATLDGSARRRHGLNIGIQQMMLPLFGLGFAPLIVTNLLHIVNWRMIFCLFALPGLAIAWAVWRVIPPYRGAKETHRNSLADWRQVLGYRNIPILMLLMLCWLTCLITTSALLPSYFIDFLHLPFGTMGGVMSAIGIGSMVGTAVLPTLSDYVGRKPVMVLGAVGTGLALVGLSQCGARPDSLFAWLFLVHFFNNALITLTVGPICAETVPASLMATASGMVIACGELFGGGIAPMIGGQVAQHFGIDHILWLPMLTSAISLVFCLFLVETYHPRLSTSY